MCLLVVIVAVGVGAIPPSIKRQGLYIHHFCLFYRVCQELRLKPSKCSKIYIFVSFLTTYNVSKIFGASWSLLKIGSSLKPSLPSQDKLVKILETHVITITFKLRII